MNSCINSCNRLLIQHFQVFIVAAVQDWRHAKLENFWKICALFLVEAIPFSGNQYMCNTWHQFKY